MRWPKALLAKPVHLGALLTLLAGGVAVGVVLLNDDAARKSRNPVVRVPPRPPTGRLVYSDAKGRLWILELRQRTPRRIKMRLAGDNPAFSKDGRQIVFRSTSEDLFAVGPEGASLRNLTKSELREGEPDWMPNGRRIVFVGTPDFRSRLWSMRANGGGAKQLSDVFGLEPAVSPDGRWIAFSGSGTTTNFDILVIRPSGLGIRQVTSFPDWETEPSWSPDGRRIAFSRGSTGGDHDIWVINADGSNARQLTRLENRDDTAPTWSPDGAWIAFVSAGTLRVVAANGSAERSLRVRGQFPDWAQ